MVSQIIYLLLITPNSGDSNYLFQVLWAKMQNLGDFLFSPSITSRIGAKYARYHFLIYILFHPWGSYPFLTCSSTEVTHTLLCFLGWMEYCKDFSQKNFSSFHQLNEWNLSMQSRILQTLNPLSTLFWLQVKNLDTACGGSLRVKFLSTTIYLGIVCKVFRVAEFILNIILSPNSKLEQ